LTEFQNIVIKTNVLILKFNGNSKYEGGQETVAFSTNIAVYLLNGTKWAHGYNGSLIGSHRDPITFDDLE